MFSRRRSKFILFVFLLFGIVSAGGGGGGGSSADCGPGRYRDPSTDRCEACPNCADYLESIGASDANRTSTPSATVGAETPTQRAARFEVCSREPRCRGEIPASASRRYLLVRDRSDLEPLGLGSAAAVVGCVCLIAGAVVLGRHLRLRRLQQRDLGSSEDNDGGAVVTADDVDNVRSSVALTGPRSKLEPSV